MRITRLCRVVITAASIWSLATAVADCRITHIGVIPPEPSSNDSVVISIDGYFYDGCWHVDSSSRSRSGNTFLYNIEAVDQWRSGGACPLVLIEYHIRDTVGILPAGTYLIAMTEWHQSLRDPLPDFGSIQFTVYGPTGISQGGTEGLPDGFAVYQNYPNPFNASTVISYDARSAGPLALEIFNILGQRVFVRNEESVTPGGHTFTWNGVDQSGASVPSGLYLYRVTAGGVQQTRKMVLLK